MPLTSQRQLLPLMKEESVTRSERKLRTGGPGRYPNLRIYLLTHYRLAMPFGNKQKKIKGSFFF